jgi:Domain of unknown function (DUF1996)
MLALVVTLLVGSGIVLAAGSAAAAGEGRTDLTAADQANGDDRDGNGNGNGNGDGDGRNGRGGDRDRTRDGADDRQGDDRQGDERQGDIRNGNGQGDNRDRGDANNRGDNNRNNRNNRNNDPRNNRNNNNRDDNKKNDNKDDEEFPGRDKAEPASDDDFIDINDVPPDNDRSRGVGAGDQRGNRTGDRGDNRGNNRIGAQNDNRTGNRGNNQDNGTQGDDRRNGTGGSSTGSFVARCGRPDGHQNSDNFMVTPGKRNGAQHVHNYVGNLSTDADSTDDSLHAAGTSCDRDNKSTFFWPVVRDTSQQGGDADEDGGGLDGNFGKILPEKTVDLRFLGSPNGKVVPMPDDLTIIMGDAKAKTNGSTNANAQWTCTGFENRVTDKYPLCPAGSDLVRILEFPSCWDGENLDSADHRSHVVFPDEDGRCDDGFKAIPRLRETLTYNRPNGRNFAVDTFPDQQHDPSTDHADFMNIASDDVLKLAADCINSGRNC